MTPFWRNIRRCKLVQIFDVAIENLFLKKWANPSSFSFIFGLFQTNIYTILQQINVKNVHPVYGTVIRTLDLQNMSLLPKPLDQFTILYSNKQV